MTRNRRIQIWFAAASPPVIALALAAAAWPAAVSAQESLPSVSDYRLPEPSARPSGRASTAPQGPVDGDNPVVLRPAGEPGAAQPDAAPSPAPSPEASAAAAPSPATPAGRTARAVSSGTARPAGSAGGAIGTVAPQTPANTASVLPTIPPPVAAGSPPSIVAPIGGAAPDAPGITWKVHSANDEAPSPVWPWLAGIGVLLASNLLLLLLLFRRRRARAAAAYVEPVYEAPVQRADSQEAPAVLPEPAAVQATAPHPATTLPARPAPLPEPAADPVAEAEPDAALDLLTLLGKPESGVQPAGSPAGGAQAPRPTLGVIVNPLDVTLAARRLSATLMNTVLNYELVIANRSDRPIGPVTVAGDMIGAHASIPERSQLEMNGHAIDPQHRIDTLDPGESVTVSGEFRLPLTSITPIRSGNAALFVPLARFRVEALRDNAPPLSVNHTFVIGESQDQPGAALKPFRLDLGPRLYSHLGQREVAATG